MVRGQPGNNRHRYQPHINFTFQQHFSHPGRVITHQLYLVGNGRFFQAIDQWFGIKVVDNADTNLIQLGYFCGQR